MSVTSRTITIYAVKSSRSNAQCTTHTWQAWRGYDNLKKKFTHDMDYMDIQDWMKRQPNRMFRMSVYSDNICMHTWNTTLYHDSDSVYKVAHRFMELFNCEV
jgi:hypothetical protein